MIYKIVNSILELLSCFLSKDETKNTPEVLYSPQQSSHTEQNSSILPQINQIEWVECEDVYKPTQKPILEFITEREINLSFPQVYILKEACDALTNHLEADISVEHGGILFGQAYSDYKLGTYVEITAAVAAPRTIGTGTHLEFTSETWQGIMNYVKQAHPEANIVGWYHSHPNLGVFMSGTDMRTQRAFFLHPWCVSIVYDPVRKDVGYFLGVNAERVKAVEFKQTAQTDKKTVQIK